MMSIAARYLAALLSTAAVVEGYYLYLQEALTLPPAAAEFQARHDRWVSELENMKRGTNPFAAEEASPMQGNSLEEWFRARTGAAGIKSEISNTETEIIVSFRIPGLQSDSLKVAVDNARVLITCVADMIEEKGEGTGAYRREGLRQYELIMPLPAHADSARHRVVRDKEAFKIIFIRLEDPSLKS